MKRVAILQSNYIPWKGYFDLIASVDEFVIYDDMQFTRRDWRNRNQIKTPQGPIWLTVPVKVKGKYDQTIRETEIDGTDWAAKHWKSFAGNYARAACFAEMAEVIKPLYLNDYPLLTGLNRTFLDAICAYLGIHTRIRDSSEFTLADGKTERLADLCRQLGADEYVSGPAARDYLDESVFQRLGMTVSWFDYSGYPEYKQLWGDFTHNVSVLDLLFNCGRKAPHYMKFVGR
jgi:hypothetical protein